MPYGERVSDAGWSPAIKPVPELWVGSMGTQVPRAGDDVQARRALHSQEGNERSSAGNGDTQSRLVSAIESFCNVSSGWFLSLMVWQFAVAPLFGYEVTLNTNIALTSIFTGVSMARGYLWRRFFARGLHMAVARWVRAATTRGES